jgi:hypothetical protein
MFTEWFRGLGSKGRGIHGVELSHRYPVVMQLVFVLEPADAGHPPGIAQTCAAVPTMSGDARLVEARTSKLR